MSTYKLRLLLTALEVEVVEAALDAESQKDVMNGGAYLLVSESAVNIPGSLHEMRETAAQLKETLS